MSKIKNIGKAVLISGILVPAMGVLAHFTPRKGAFWKDNASLSHRFECAYTFNPKPEHREYMSWEYRRVDSYPRYSFTDGRTRKPIDVETGQVFEDGWIESCGEFDKLCHMEKYAANPWLTASLHLLVAGAAYARLRRREQEMTR